MYTKIALIFLGVTVSVGGALALVLAQTSSVKRPMAPQVASLSSEISVKPRIVEPAIAPVPAVTAPAVAAVQQDYAPSVAVRPTMRPLLKPLSDTAVARFLAEPAATVTPEAEPVPRVEVARAPAPASPAFTPSQSEPSLSAFDSFSSSLKAAPQPQTQRLGLVEQAGPAPEALTETWAIGVYR